MVNRRGFLRIVEAMLAILLIIGVLLLVISGRQIRNEGEIEEPVTQILEEIAQNKSLRGMILNYDLNQPFTENRNSFILKETDSFVEKRIRNKALNHSVRICGLENCPLQPYPKRAENILSGERVISANVTQTAISPRKVKIFLWKEE